MIVVADTSPINYLILIEEIDILTKMYGRVVIPRAVRDELLRRNRLYFRSQRQCLDFASRRYRRT